MSGETEVTSINNFPVCGLFTFFLSVPTETIVCSFGVKTQDLPLFVDPEREGGHRCSYEESEKKKKRLINKNEAKVDSAVRDVHRGKLHEHVTQ